jgi:hypothetical protein
MPRPSVIGPIFASTSRTSRSRRSNRGAPAKPSPRSAGICAATCRKPPSSAPAASARAGSTPLAASSAGSPKHAAIIGTFSSAGANDETAKRPYVLSAAMPSAAVPMKKMYGNTARVSVSVLANCSGRAASPPANSESSCGANTTPSTVVTSSDSSDSPRIRAKKSLAPASPSRALTFAITGITALVAAPSANSCLSAFGMVNATQNASVCATVNMAAMAISRPRPRNREASVPSATTPARPAIAPRSLSALSAGDAPAPGCFPMESAPAPGDAAPSLAAPRSTAGASASTCPLGAMPPATTSPTGGRTTHRRRE